LVAWAVLLALHIPCAAHAAGEERAATPLDSLLSDAAPPDPRGALTLRHAQRLAITHHPDVRGAAWDVRAASARTTEAARLANPSFSFEAENLGAGGDVPLEEYTLSAEQKFDLGGKRAARRQVAGALAELANADLSLAQRQVTVVAAGRFVDAWALQERARSVRRAEALSEEQVRAAGERFHAGAGPEVERIRAEAARAERRAERRRLEVELAAARRQLAATWGAAEASFDSLVFVDPGAGAPRALDELLADVVRHPEIVRSSAQIRVAEARAREANAARAIDLSLQAGARYLAAPDAVGAVAAVSLPLPLWNRQRGTAAAAEADRGAAQARGRAVSLRIEAALRDAYARYQGAAEMHASLRAEALPHAEAALQGLVSGYRAGRFRYVEVLDAQRALLEIELAAVGAAADAWRARSEIELLAGEPEGDER
jgi:cobalt-zinc-cadmium efflux system outer membrane protein